MGLLEDKATELLVDVMDEYGIDPGELNSKIGKTLELIESLKPMMEGMSDTTDSLHDDVQELGEQMEQFNDNSENMVEAMDDLANTLDKFGDMMEEIEEESN